MLLTIILIISFLICLCLIIFNAVKVVWLPFIFIGNAVLLFLLWLLFCFVCTRFIDMNVPTTKPSPFFRWCANVLIDFLVKFFRMNIEIVGSEKLPKEMFMLVGNHRSVFDPMIAMLDLSSYNMGFVAKREVSGYPIVDRLMHKCFCLPLDRNSLKSEVKTIKNAAELIKNQTASIGIYPEGRRNTNDKLLPFMNGAFKLAKKAECPVVVTYIEGTDKVIGNFFRFRSSKVRMEYVSVIDTDIVCNSSTSQLSEMVRELLRERSR